jgi:cell division protease FtsH
MDRLSGLLGGRAAEEMVFGEVTTGAQNDLERATALARQMVAVYGMSERIGLVNCAQRQSTFLGGLDGPTQCDCSEETAREIDEEVKAILDDAYARTKEVLAAHRDQLEKIAGELLKKESLDGREFYRLVGKEMPRAKEPAPPPPEAAAAKVQKQLSTLDFQLSTLKLSAPCATLLGTDCARRNFSDASRDRAVFSRWRRRAWRSAQG